MYKDILRSIDHVAIWPVISFIIFFLFFLFLVWWAFTVDKNFVSKMSNMPLEGAGEPNKNSVTKIKSSRS